jgi:hypothetical protein
VGAAPQLSYRYFINRIAASGYTVVQTPYPFTFAHRALAKDLKKVRRDLGMAVPQPAFSSVLRARF